MKLEDLKRLYLSRKADIEKRINEFEEEWKNRSNEDIFAELAFCLLTPQSKAKACWKAIEDMCRDGVLLKGSEKEIARYLKNVRFGNNKARYIVLARKIFTKHGKLEIKNFLQTFNDPKEIREWLVRNVKGLGYKEASHFLRNIGMGKEFAILDRHILKNLKALGIIDSIPTSMTRRKYLEIEEKMRGLAERLDIPLSHLDLLLWSKETGEIFK